MKSINFTLLDSSQMKFETNYYVTKQMKHFHPKRLSNFRLAATNQEYDYNIKHLDDGNYYSDDNIESNQEPSYHTSSNIAQNSSFEKIFDNFDYDMIIPQDYIDKISQEIENLNSFAFPKRFFEVFKYELKKVEESSAFVNKYQISNKETEKTTQQQMKYKLLDWVPHFFPTYAIIYKIDDLACLFYDFTIKYDIPKKEYKKIFQKCMNVADQVASQLSRANKKAAFYVDRLKSNDQKCIE